MNVHIANSSSRTCKKIKVTSKGIGGKKYSKFIYFVFLFVSFFFSSSSSDFSKCYEHSNVLIFSLHACVYIVEFLESHKLFRLLA